MRRPILSLTRNKQLGVVCWLMILLADLWAHFFTVRTLPTPIRVAVTVFMAAVGLTVVVTTLGFFTEKGDERAEENSRRADAALFTLFFTVMAALIFLTPEGSQALTLGRTELLMVFAAVCLARDALFLAFERFGR